MLKYIKAVFHVTSENSERTQASSRQREQYENSTTHSSLLSQRERLEKNGNVFMTPFTYWM